MNYIETLSMISDGTPTKKLKEFQNKDESEDFEIIEKSCNELASLIKNPSNFKIVIKALSNLKVLESYTNLLEQKIHINSFQDKYGNEYLQARTSLKVNNKTKWVSAYIGSITEYPKGVDDKEALKKGKVLLRKKIKKYFI